MSEEFATHGLAEHFYYNALFVGPGDRQAVNSGKADSTCQVLVGVSHRGCGLWPYPKFGNDNWISPFGRVEKKFYLSLRFTGRYE